MQSFRLTCVGARAALCQPEQAMSYKHLLSHSLAGHSCGCPLRQKHLAELPSPTFTVSQAARRQSVQCRADPQLSPQWYQPPGKRFPASEDENGRFKYGQRTRQLIILQSYTCHLNGTFLLHMQAALPRLMPLTLKSTRENR